MEIVPGVHTGAYLTIDADRVTIIESLRKRTA
jgi:hypothetical protein